MNRLRDPLFRLSLLHLAVLAKAGPEHGTRRRVFAMVQAHPGIHQRDLARRTGLTQANAEHHLRHLVKSGLLVRQKHGGFTCYFATPVGQADMPPVPAADRAKLVVLRQTRPLRIVATLLESNPREPRELAQAVGITAGTLTYQVKKLEAAGLVTRLRSAGRTYVRLTDRDATVRLLLSYEPPADLVAGFQDLWDGVGIL